MPVSQGGGSPVERDWQTGADWGLGCPRKLLPNEPVEDAGLARVGAPSKRHLCTRQPASLSTVCSLHASNEPARTSRRESSAAAYTSAALASAPAYRHCPSRRCAAMANAEAARQRGRGARGRAGRRDRSYRAAPAGGAAADFLFFVQKCFLVVSMRFVQIHDIISTEFLHWVLCLWY